MTKRELCQENKYINSKWVNGYDTALPQDYLDHLTKKFSDLTKIPRDKVYREILYNCVYVYDNNGASFLYCIGNSLIAHYVTSEAFADYKIPASIISFYMEEDDE